MVILELLADEPGYRTRAGAPGLGGNPMLLDLLFAAAGLPLAWGYASYLVTLGTGG